MRAALSSYLVWILGKKLYFCIALLKWTFKAKISYENYLSLYTFTNRDYILLKTIKDSFI